MKKLYIPPQAEVVDIKAGDIMEEGPGLVRSQEKDQDQAQGKDAWLWDDDSDQDSYVQSSRNLWDD